MRKNLNVLAVGGMAVLALSGCAATTPTADAAPSVKPAETVVSVDEGVDAQLAYLCGALAAGSELVDEYVYRYESGELTDADVPHALGVVRGVFEPVAALVSARPDLNATTVFVATSTTFGTEPTGFGSAEWDDARDATVNACPDIFPGTTGAGG